MAEIVAVSVEGRAPKNDPALFALAIAAAADDVHTRRAALDALAQVARTGTHLFAFASFIEGFRGWGRSLRRAVARWYAERPLDALGYQAVKYRRREGMTHRDLLRLSHPARRVSAGNPTNPVSDGRAPPCSSGSCGAATQPAGSAMVGLPAETRRAGRDRRGTVAVGHALAPAVLHRLVAEGVEAALRRLPTRDGPAQRATPAAKALDERGEREQVRAGTGRLRERIRARRGACARRPPRRRWPGRTGPGRV